MSMSDDERREEEFAVKSRKDDFAFLETEFGIGIAFGRHPPACR